MIKVKKPINLEQLDKELNANGLIAEVNADGQITSVGLAENATITKEQLIDGIELHTAIFTEPTIADKLASVGLNLDDLKVALGLA